MTDAERAVHWAKEIEKAQLYKEATINGRAYPRVRYGDGDIPGLPFDQYRETCRDCGVKLGQYHVENCCVERCPKCGGQAIACMCANEP
jgi:hypothetical protein